MTYDTWTHKLARILVRPLLGTGVTPTHITHIRVGTGIIACLFLTLGTNPGWLWGGIFWLLSTFLDRADGELARIGNMRSEAGHRYDYMADNICTALFFAAVGLGLRHSFLHQAAIPLGLITATCLLLCNAWSERLEQANGFTQRAYSGRWGFDPDDLLYLMAPLAWLHILAPILIGAAIGTVTIATITYQRLRQLPHQA